MDFSDITFEDLTELGVKNRVLVVGEAILKELTKGQTADTKAKIQDLQSRLTSIYEVINIDVCIVAACSFWLTKSLL